MAQLEQIANVEAPKSNVSNSQTNNTNSAANDDEKQESSNDLLGLSVHSSQNGANLRITVTSPEYDMKEANSNNSNNDANNNADTDIKDIKRLGSIICCVVDVSGSMNAEATIKDENGKSESHGLSILDLVKHSIKTIIHCLNKNDQLSIISYSNNASIVFELSAMDEKGRKDALSKLETLSPSGGTNLWGGLEMGLNELNKVKNVTKYNSSVLLFTDGLPNIRPGNGELGSLDKYISNKCENNTLPGIINTYGFGYSLDSPLLNDLAVKGNGNYFFIPDSSFVGTIFVNSISNFVCNVASNVKLTLSNVGGNDSGNDSSARVLGGFNNVCKDGKIVVDLGSVAYGQSKTVMIVFDSNNDGSNDQNNQNNDNNNENEGQQSSNSNGNNNNSGNTDDSMDIGSMVNADSLSYVSLTQMQAMNKANKYELSNDGKLSKINYYRLQSCDVIRECMESMQLNDTEEAETQIKKLIKEMSKDNIVKNDAFIKDLLKDLKGQVFEAIQTSKAYKKWGKHYLLSLINAHLQQYNNNFKDPGVQHYGGQLFQTIKDKADKIFVGLPPPTATRQTYNYNYGSYNPHAKNTVKAAYKAPTYSMSAYYNASGGCIAGECKVLMADNSYKLVKELRKGDKLFSKNGHDCEIMCVLRMKCKDSLIRLCTIGDLKITPWHPVKCNNNKWVFPAMIENIENKIEQCDYVYNFVLKGSDSYSMVVNGIECVTLGHEMINDNVLKHEYFGNKAKIIDDLSKFNVSGWNSGYVNLQSNSFKRDESNKVVRIA